MDGTNLAVVAEIGQRLLSTKLFSISMYWLWIYDYFLTFGDEVDYAWSGERSWIFALFIANRYTPVLHVLYKCIVMFNYTKCKKSVWEIILYTTVVIVLAQITMCLRVYAVTGRNKLVGSTLSAMIVAQLCFGIYFTVVNGTTPLGPLPEIDLDAYKVCFPPRWRPGETAFASISVVFDLLVFLIILITARRPGTSRLPGISTILDAILQDATVFFLLIVASQLVLCLFLFFAPTQIQLMPGLSHTMFLPIMTSRLMLSLKKVAIEPTGMWSLSTMGSGRGTIHFASDAFGGSQEISETLPTPDEEGVELDFVPRLSRNSGSQQVR